jgi:hypothetical protein
MKQTKPIQVFIRHCYHSPNSILPDRRRPKWFDKAAILNNFKKTINVDLADYTIIYDEHYGSIKDTFLKDEKNIEIINCGCDSKSFSKTIDIALLKNLSDDTIVYFLEDDYLHLNGWCEIMMEGFSLPVHYVSLYDHLDKYTDSGYSDLLSKIMVSSSVHWRTTPSTCNTYAAKVKTLKEDYEIHKLYSDNSPSGITIDHQKFIHLMSIGKILITPMPAYSTHCDLLQSPTIDWEKVISLTY